MRDRLRAVGLGVVLGVAPLLLLDLAATLTGVADTTSAWWAVAAYALVGAVIAAAVLRAAREPLIPAVAAVVLVVALAPGLPEPLAGLPRLVVIGEVAVRELPVAVVLAAVCVVGAVRGRR